MLKISPVGGGGEREGADSCFVNLFRLILHEYELFLHYKLSWKCVAFDRRNAGFFLVMERKYLIDKEVFRVFLQR